MDGLYDVKVLLAILFLSGYFLSADTWVEVAGEVLLSTPWGQHCSFPDVLWAEDVFVPSIDGSALITPCLVVASRESAWC